MFFPVTPSRSPQLPPCRRLSISLPPGAGAFASAVPGKVVNCCDFQLLPKALSPSFNLFSCFLLLNSVPVCFLLGLGLLIYSATCCLILLFCVLFNPLNWKMSLRADTVFCRRPSSVRRSIFGASSDFTIVIVPLSVQRTLIILSEPHGVTGKNL